jgi:uncharacterized protein (TIGR02569 family)
MVVVMTRPPAQILAAYDLDPGRLRPLGGGQGTAWSAGNLILKPLDMPLDELAWQEQILSHIREDGFRLARPVRALDGQLAVEGWSAWQRIEGEHLPRRWAEICAAGQRFHRASVGIPVPGWHRQRNDVFAQADLAAWDDAALSQFCSLAPVAQLAGRFRPLHGHDQLIHGDLTTNVLFHPTLPPGIIDLSPYWRPPLFATAIVIVDAMVWEGAGPSVLPLIGHRPHAAQYLLRAAVFRLVMDHLCNPERRTPPTWWPAMLQVTGQLCDLAESADPQP